MQEAINTINNQPYKRASVGGEAPARSSLVSRDLTAEPCLIALASLGLLIT